MRRGAAARTSAAAALGELIVERQSGHVRAADCDAHKVIRCRARRKLRCLGKPSAERAEREILRAVKRISKRAECGVVPRGRGQCNAESKPIRLQSGRHRDGGEIEQVYEIRVIAERGVEADRVSQQFGDGVLAAGCRRDQNVHRLPSRSRGAAQFLEPVVGARMRPPRSAAIRASII